MKLRFVAVLCLAVAGCGQQDQGGTGAPEPPDTGGRGSIVKPGTGRPDSGGGVTAPDSGGGLDKAQAPAARTNANPPAGPEYIPR
ncbi:MAG TPA: hypothetical protein VN673_16005 [Clostridia bacterium]|nr:hypothetical protein [Clostridia bacterium]